MSITPGGGFAYPPIPTGLRHRQRYVHSTLVDVVRQGLTEFGWVNAPTIFSALPVTVLDYQPDDRGEAIAANTVVVSMGDEFADEPEELGAGLQSASTPVFVDIYGEQQAIAVAIAGDVKMLLKDRYLPVRDWSQPGAPAIPGMQIEMENTVGPERPQASIGAENFKRYWRVIKSTAVTYFQD